MLQGHRLMKSLVVVGQHSLHQHPQNHSAIKDIKASWLAAVYCTQKN